LVGADGGWGKPSGATFPSQNGKIAYAHDDGNDYEIYKINATGGTPLKLTSNCRDERYFSWGSRPSE
jgi:hypothetical protein